MLISLFLLNFLMIQAQQEKLPIIDMHLHGLNQYSSLLETMPCIPEPCTGLKTEIQSLSELIPQTVEEMKKNQVVLGIVTTPDLEELSRWKKHPRSFK